MVPELIKATCPLCKESFLAKWKKKNHRYQVYCSFDCTKKAYANRLHTILKSNKK